MKMLCLVLKRLYCGGEGEAKQNKVLNVLLISLEALMHEKDSKRRTMHEGRLHFPRVLLQSKL